MVEWLGSRIGIYGYGRTGKALVDYLCPLAAELFVLVDDPSKLDLSESEKGAHCTFVTGQDVLETAAGLDSLVLSPGVPLGNPAVKLAQQRGVAVMSELELASRICPGHIIAITGTNGKSTTTMMLGHVLEALGPAHVLGNIGSPLVGSLDNIHDGDYVALEVSSFQLEALESFCPRIAVYTNLSADHLDRHGSMEEYARIKRSMAARMGPDGFVITNALSDELSPQQFENQQPVFLQYRSTPGNPLKGAWVSNDKIHVDLGSEIAELPLDCVKLPGSHNVENAMAVILAAMLCGATTETVIERLSTFTGYEHRLELCRNEAGIRFYNDSKATNPEATITALRAIDPPLSLILGGRDKNTGLEEMCEWVKRKAKHVTIYGEAQGRFAQSLQRMGYNNFDRVENLESALTSAIAGLAGEPGSVLLSPACASFDQYSSYEERGEHFKTLVAALTL